MDLPSRMKSGLFGSRPSAIHATVTPAPVMPAACASLACVVVRSSGSSGLAAVPQMLDAGELPLDGPDEAAGAWLAGAGGTSLFWSGTTEATAGLAASDTASAGDTVAANEATALYPITLVPPAALTCEISGDSVVAALPDWLFRMTMTGEDLAAADGDVAVRAEVAAVAVAAPASTHARDAPAAMPMTCGDLLMVPSAEGRPGRRRTRNQREFN